MATWTLYSFTALMLWGFWGMFTKVATGHLGPQKAYLLGIIGYLPILGILLHQTGGRISFHPLGWSTATAAGACTAFGLFFYYRALALGPASVVVPLTSLYQVVTVALCWLFLGESLSYRQMAGLVLAVAAVWLLAE
jgi:transporter family protein